MWVWCTEYPWNWPSWARTWYGSTLTTTWAHWPWCVGSFCRKCCKDVKEPLLTYHQVPSSDHFRTWIFTRRRKYLTSTSLLLVNTDIHPFFSRSRSTLIIFLEVYPTKCETLEWRFRLSHESDQIQRFHRTSFAAGSQCSNFRLECLIDRRCM